MCSDDRGWPENPLVYCDGQSCTVAVHQACYGIVTVPTGPWYCRKCESQERAVKVKCELCPSKYGALKRTDNGGWAHVVCALYIPEVRFGNVTTMEPIQLQLIPQERFNKVCYICDEGNKSSVAGVGACMQCNKSGCKQQFHVTCAQGLGLLCEEAGNYLDNVKYCGYCQHHYSKLKKGINIKTIPPYKPLPSEIHQSDSSSEKETDGSGNPLSSGSASTTANLTSSAGSTATSSAATLTSNSATTAGALAANTTGATAHSTATTGKRKYYSNSKAKIEKTTANSNQTSSTTATSKAYQKKATNSSSTSSNTTDNPTKSSTSSSSSSASSSSTKNNNQSNNKSVSSASNSSNISSATLSTIKADEQASFKVEVKVEVKKEVEDAVAAAAAASALAAPFSGKGKKRKANSRTPTPNTTNESNSATTQNSDSVADSATKKEKDTTPVESKKTKPSDVPPPLPPSAPLLTPSQPTVSTNSPQPINPLPPPLPAQTRGATPTPPQPPPTTITPNTTAIPLPIPSSTVTTTATLAPQSASSQVNSLVVSVPLLPLVPSTSSSVSVSHSVSPRPIVTAAVERLTPTLTVDSRLQPGVQMQHQQQQQQQVLSGSLDINGVTVSQSGLVLEPDTMLTSELTGSGGLKIMFEKQPPPSSAVQAEIDRITPSTEAPIKRSRSQSMEKNDKIMRSSKKRGTNGLANLQHSSNIPPSAPSPVAGSSAVAAAGLSAAAATPPPSIVNTITKRASRSQHPTPPPTLSSSQHYAQQSGSSSGMLGISLSATNQIKDSPPSSPSSESLGAPPVTVGRKKGRKSAPASVSSSSSSNAAKDTKDNIKLFQNGVHAPHMLGNQLNPNSNMAQKMSDHLNSELEAHSIFNSTESAALVGPQLHNRVLASARSSSTGGSSTASAGSGLSSMLGGGSGAIPQTLDQLLERQWEQGSQFLMEQAQHFDIASLLSCLHQLRAENTRLEEHVSSLLQRRDHLLAVNARLAIPLTGPPATPQSSHPHTVNNIHPNVASNHADINVSRSSRHGSSATSGSTSGGVPIGGYSHGGPLENGLPAEAAYAQQHSQHRSPAQGPAQPSPTIRHSSSGYSGSGSGSGSNVSGLLRTTESSSGGGGGNTGSRSSSSSSSRSHQQQQQQQQHYNMYQQTAQQQQMSMRREAEMHHQSSSKPS